MSLTTKSKIEKFLEKIVIESIEAWKNMLLKGDLYNYEKVLSESLAEVHNFISELLLGICSEELSEPLKEKGKKDGVKKMIQRPLSIRISTGYTIKVPSIYAKKVKKGWGGSRHLLVTHWKIIKGSSPLLYDKVAYCSALCPSYDFAHQALRKFGTNVCLSSVRDITNRLAEHCFEHGEENVMLEETETLIGKRVVISMDGGRTRTRVYTGELNDKGQAEYETPWKEPKLFVIDVLDEHGHPSRFEVPIYGCRFDESAVLDLLAAYLKRLKIEQAKEVQILADGAPWIWNHLKPLLVRLKVDPSSIVETLDYYHASGYIHDLVAHMPKKIGKKKRKAYLSQFKDWLWNGKSEKIVQKCRAIYKRPNQLINRWIRYIDKHQNKTQYAVFESNSLMCGSGIIESAIRRIINLRFKNASTFWKKENVEKLFFFRAALLSKRWDIVMSNLAKAA